MDSEPKNYEIAYLFSPSLPEEEVLTYAGKLSTLIEEAQGAIGRMETPRRRKLAYPVKKAKEAYFGWTAFRMAPENAALLKKKLALDSSLDGMLLRHLLVEEEIEKRPPLTRPISPRPPRVSAEPKAPTAPKEPKPEEKLDLEALDKKLEEILGK